MKTYHLSQKEVGELFAREFHGEEQWKQWKINYDCCMAFRKSIKGKPTDEQRVELENNARMIDWYNTVLYHSSLCTKCECNSCARKRQIVIDPLHEWKLIVETLNQVSICTEELNTET